MSKAEQAPAAWAAWTQEVHDRCRVDKRALDALVYEHLLCEGMVQTAESFQRASGCAEVGFDVRKVTVRQEVVQDVRCGRFDQAIDSIERMHEGLLRKNPDLHFQLQKHLVVDMIVAGDIEGAVSFAQTRLAPLAKDNEHLRKQLEEVMSLLLFSDVEHSPLEHLLSAESRQGVARLTNTVLLRESREVSNSKLVQLLRKARWYEQWLCDHGIAVPVVFGCKEDHPANP